MADRWRGLGGEGFLKSDGRELDPRQAARREYEFSSPPRWVVQAISRVLAVLFSFGGLSQPGGRWSRAEWERRLLYQSCVTERM